ncbi:hypothetical protein Trisim1_007281 [Trichoderma cf. simile WF8]|uniref:Uncharacterized protein n=1 Tax=Trichoderma guizhouense TaxID=1491466 RepID=A0A1T3CTE5_9HYPO|nr:hypothetical protein A0O28_0026990 [Trichoderma guizhouense]
MASTSTSAPPDLSLVRPNPCPAPSVPPMQIEIEDIPVDISHEFYISAVKAVKGYWAQATNMNAVDQQQYKDILKAESFVIEQSAMNAPSTLPY